MESILHWHKEPQFKVINIFSINDTVLNQSDLHKHWELVYKAVLETVITVTAFYYCYFLRHVAMFDVMTSNDHVTSVMNPHVLLLISMTALSSNDTVILMEIIGNDSLWQLVSHVYGLVIMYQGSNELDVFKYQKEMHCELWWYFCSFTPVKIWYPDSWCSLTDSLLISSMIWQLFLHNNVIIGMCVGLV